MTPLRRLIRAFGYSLQGLKAAFETEWAFRVEVFVAPPMAVLALLLPVPLAEKALLLSSLFLVLMAELVNTAIETVIERIAPDRHPLSGKAKDIGSAVVLLALINAGLIWGLVLLDILTRS